jgi:hypothetical protein
MGIADKLLRAAGEIAESYHGQIHDLRLELERKRAKLLEINGTLKMARLAPKRVATFVVMDGIDYHCPKCWIREDRAGSGNLNRAISGVSA